jgi:hypothetical protein
MLEESTDNDQKKMISRNSSTKEEFVKVKEDYQASLNKSGYKKVIEFNLYTKKKKHRRNRIVTWFNPPWSDNVKTNIAEKFLQLIDKYHEKCMVATAEEAVILAHWEANVYKDQWFTRLQSPQRRATQ